MLVIDALGSGGAQRLFINIANGLSKKHEVVVFLYNNNSDFYYSDLLDTIPVISPPRSGKGFSLSVLQDMTRHARAQDVMISFLPTANIYCAMAGVFSRKTRHIACEMSVTNDNEGKYRRFMTNVANRLATHVVCNSHTQAEYVAAKIGARKEVSTIWNGCNDMPFHSKRHVDPREHSMIVVGRVAYPKNGLRLLQALNIFYEKHGFIPTVSWAGRDDIDSARSIELKHQMVEYLNAHNHIIERFHFLGEVADVNALYNSAHSLLSPSIFEGLPVVICEAMLSGCPVIASDVSDNSLIIGEGEERGFLCDPLSAKNIAEAIERRVFCESQALDQKIIQARSFAQKEFSVKNMVDEYDKLVTSLV